MFRKPKTVILCFIVAYSLLFLLAGIVAHHIYSDGPRARDLDRRIRALEKRTGAHVVVNGEGALEIRFDEDTADNR